MPAHSGRISTRTRVTERSPKSPTSLREPRQAPSVGRALRVLLGLALIVYVTPVYFRVPARVAVGSLLLILELIGVYGLIHFVVARRIIIAFSPGAATVTVHVLLVVLYVAGAFRLPIFGHGAGQLAAVAFLGISLVVAGVRGVPGCELMAIPGVFFRKGTELSCLVFSPLDRLERRLRSK
jgi:hypothetical protein